MRPVLLHICPRGEWRRNRSASELRPDSLAESGFAHLSTPEQVHLPADRLLGATTEAEHELDPFLTTL